MPVVFPPSVEAMLAPDSRAPTCPIADYIEAEKLDGNLFWRIDSGHHQNLLDDAIEQIERLREQLHHLLS